MNRLNTQLKERAIDLGLCKQWQGAWQRSKSQRELIEMFVSGIDFCIEHDYPDNAFIKDNFDPAILEENKIFVDRKGFDVSMGSGVYVVQGDSSGVIRLDGNDVATIYLRHTSKVKIEARGIAKAFVHKYDDSVAFVEQLQCSSVTMFDKGV